MHGPARLSTAAALFIVTASATAGGALAAEAPAHQLSLDGNSRWTGCHVGVNAGGGWARLRFVDGDGSFFNGLTQTDAGTQEAAGFVGGGRLGCDYQLGAWVVGLQGMFDGTTLQDRTPLPNFPHVTFQTRMPWLATLAARVGYAIQPATLVYLTGGGAWIRDKFDYRVIPVLVGQAPYHATADLTRSGWTVGGGVEHQFARQWSAFVEYNYMDFGNHTTTFTANPGLVPSEFHIDVSQHVQAVRIGVKYLFGVSH